ncbi:MAG: molybdopterin-dependent oxidoreductase [Acidobacteriaceae bacterium]|nr:molybdopterin-dependent oxidoreductase [Acidobacteriaceae bacterium]
MSVKSDRHPEKELPPEEARREMQAMTRRSFAIGGAAAVAGIGLYKWVTGSAAEDGVPWPQRRVLDWNARLSGAYLNDHHLMPTYSVERIGGVKPNGDIGLESPVEGAENWKVHVKAAGARLSRDVNISEIKSLKHTEMITLFCCIEGWSGIAHWTGVRFSDFTRHFLPSAIDLPRYIYMATTGEDYYVGLDMKSAMHPQTLLAWEQNGKPLEAAHGAPLRLVIPVKYGIKNIKRIGVIEYTDTKPPDYWAEEGYDWFAGL